MHLYPMLKNLKFISLIISVLGLLPGLSYSQEHLKADMDQPQNDNIFTLEHCVEIALKNHQSLAVSAANVQMAEALYQQAMSAYWPQIAAEINAQRADQDRSFNFVGEIDGKVINNALAQSSPLFAQVLQTGLAQAVPAIPLDLKVKLFNRDIVTAGVNLTYPLFTGGKIEALVGQAEKGKKIAEQAQRKTRLEVVSDVKKYYFGAQFAKQMQRLTHETLERFQVLEELSGRLYQSGSLKIKKTDYLRGKTISAMTSSVLHEAEYATELAHEALGNAMGIEWDHQTTVSDPENLSNSIASLDALINTAQQFNPDLQQLNLAIQVSDDKIAEAKSGFYPVVGFQASAQAYLNSYNQGLVNSDNREGWTLGVGLQWNLFDGFRTSNKVKHAESEQNKFNSQKILLDKGVALQIKQQFLRIKSSRAQIKDTEKAKDYASQNRKLVLAAFQEELVEAKEVVESQIIETLAEGAFLRSQYALAQALASLEFLVGTNIEQFSE